MVEPLKCAPKTFWVNEGKHAKFRCYVMGKPEPEIEWHWEGRPLLPIAAALARPRRRLCAQGAVPGQRTAGSTCAPRQLGGPDAQCRAVA